MTIKEITKYLNIPTSTFHEWNKEGHKKYELTLLLLALPLEQVKKILEKTKQELTPKYSENTRYITLNKKLFDSDLLWTTQDKQKIKITNLITIYMNRATQQNSDKLCNLFGEDRVRQIIEKNLTNELNQKEAINQINYFNLKIQNKEYIPTKEELEDILKNPKQRVVDYYCKHFSKDELLQKASLLKPKYPIYSLIKDMVNYYEKEYLDDSRVKICS
jgi:hypothetical protein